MPRPTTGTRGSGLLCAHSSIFSLFAAWSRLAGNETSHRGFNIAALFAPQTPKSRPWCPSGETAAALSLGGGLFAAKSWLATSPPALPSVLEGLDASHPRHQCGGNAALRLAPMARSALPDDDTCTLTGCETGLAFMSRRTSPSCMEHLAGCLRVVWQRLFSPAQARGRAQPGRRTSSGSPASTSFSTKTLRATSNTPSSRRVPGLATCCQWPWKMSKRVLMLLAFS